MKKLSNISVTVYQKDDGTFAYNLNHFSFREPTKFNQEQLNDTIYNITQRIEDQLNFDIGDENE